MSRLRQLPEIYLRGALANETMKNLTAEQRLEVDALVARVEQIPAIIGHRNEFISQLSKTIGGDYRDDRASGEEEFRIATWRAVIHLLYHTAYRFKCGHCNATAYQTQRGKSKAFDRRYPICPNCDYVKALNPERFVSHDYVQTQLANRGRNIEHVSPIHPLKGKKKVPNHTDLLKDDNQLIKFMGEFIWNYFRQILNENKIKHHNKQPRLVCGPADRMAVDEIIGLLTRLNIRHYYERRDNPRGGKFRIGVDLYLTPPELNYDSETTEPGEFDQLLRKYREAGIKIRLFDREIVVEEAHGDILTVEALISTPEVVQVVTKPSSINDDEGESDSVYDRLNQKIVGGTSMSQQLGDTELVETSEVMKAIRQALPDDAKPVFDIYTETGDIYANFLTSDHSPANNSYPPKNCHVAGFLGVSPKQVSQAISAIKIQCMAHGLVGAK